MNESTAQPAHLRQFLIDFADSQLAQQEENGAMPPGHNGPYNDLETPLRNTCHWLIIWCNIYKWTEEDRFKSAATRAVQYLLSPEHRPHNGNFLFREKEGKDSCNGVIGAAWIIESLVCAYKLLDSEESYKTACELYQLHPYDESSGLWKRVDLDKTILSYDRTLNHQLWFAASSARLATCGFELAQERTKIFLDYLPNIFSTRVSGLICHVVLRPKWKHWITPGSHTHGLIQSIAPGLLKNKHPRSQIIKRDIGYHAYNLYALSILHKHHPSCLFWSSRGFRQSLQFLRGNKHIRGIEAKNPYAYPYNPVGYEAALTLQEFFPEAVEERRTWIKRQILELTNPSREFNNTPIDLTTKCARTYEAIELDDIAL